MIRHMNLIHKNIPERLDTGLSVISYENEIQKYKNYPNLITPWGTFQNVAFIPLSFKSLISHSGTQKNRWLCFLSSLYITVTLFNHHFVKNMFF